MTARAWLDDSAAYHRYDTSDLVDDTETCYGCAPDGIPVLAEREDGTLECALCGMVYAGEEAA